MASTENAVAVAVVIASLAPLPALAQAPNQASASIVVGLENRTRVVRYDAATRQKVELYRTERYVDDVTVSPDGLHIAFRERVVSGSVAKDRLVILLPTGQPVRAIEDKGVSRYAWCCRPGHLALIAAEAAEGGIGFRPKGLYLLDIRTGTEREVTGLGLPYQVAWAPFDSSLYIKSIAEVGGARRRVVYRYHAPTGTLSVTPRRGVFFSPDGEYYFDKSEEGPEWRLYRTADDLDVTARLALSPATLRFPPTGGWTAGASHVLVFVEQHLPAGWPDSVQRARVTPPRPRPTPGAQHVYPDRWNLAVDAETGRVVERFQGDIGAGWRTNARALPVERRGGVELIPPRGP